jgi:hypothetical protein
MTAALEAAAIYKPSFVLPSKRETIEHDDLKKASTMRIARSTTMTSAKSSEHEETVAPAAIGRSNDPTLTRNRTQAANVGRDYDMVSHCDIIVMVISFRYFRSERNYGTVFRLHVVVQLNTMMTLMVFLL